MLPARDAQLVQIVDLALAEATARGAGWLACRPGCTPCCHGVFRISALDALRLSTALLSLREAEPERAEALSERARAAVALLAPAFPGDAATGRLSTDDETWDAFAALPATEMACPVLDPESGRCTLYNARPMTCRVFGPPVRGEGGIGVCELCYVGASEEQILAGALRLDHEDLEASLDRELAEAGRDGETVVAFALLSGTEPPA